MDTSVKFLLGLFATTTSARHLGVDNAMLIEPKSQSGSDQYPSAQFFETRQDHFDTENTQTWQQAYYVNDTYWTGTNKTAPVFLCVGGEGPPLDGSVVVDSVHCTGVAVESLQEHGALMLAVEHRYYGCHNASACPVGSDDFNDLSYLSSRQAIADLATFHAFATQKFNLADTNKWVAFGGSYPGMLASFFRIKYPGLVHAAIASSAPVFAKLDMQGYNDVTAEAYAVASVGGSAACRTAIAVGHAKIGDMLQTEDGRASLGDTFGVDADSLKTHQGQLDFAGNGVAYFPSQSNDPACTYPHCNIEKICVVMTDTSLGDEVSRLASLVHGQAAWLAPMKRKTKLRETATGAGIPDYWGYQTCTEFGFYQTCEVGTECFYTQGLNLLPDMDDFCLAQYNITQAEISVSINETNQFYGGLRPDLLSKPASRILYPNGEVDPWHSLSILKAPTADLPVLWVPGASHHAWTHPTLPTDQASVVEARTKIKAQVTNWLQQDDK